MYHQRPRQPGSQNFANTPRPGLPPMSGSQHPNCSSAQGMAYQFPRPTQLPDELESALSIRSTRDMDHHQIDQMNQPNHNPGPVSGQHGGYGPLPGPLPADAHQQGANWPNYQPPKKLYSNHPGSATHQGMQQQVQNRQPQNGGSGSEGQSLYTPESAGSILASFGLSNEDLEVLSHYPDDQLTPDTLPFILRDIQINKSGMQKTAATASSFARNIERPSHQPGSSSSREVPSFLSVTQTAGKVIDYGHASRGQDESAPRETFKSETLSSERSSKMYLAPSLSTVSKIEKTERHRVPLDYKDTTGHDDKDYRRTTGEKRRSSRSPEHHFPPSKSHAQDRDYRHEVSKRRESSEARSESASRQSVASSSGSRPRTSKTKKLPTPTMISDFGATTPKAYPHTCSLCRVQCDREEDWVDHVNTVNHTSACRDLRNRYPDWKPNPPSRTAGYSSRAHWYHKDDSLYRSRSRSTSPPSGKRRLDPHPYRPQERPYSPHRHERHHFQSDHGYRYNSHRYSSPSPPYARRTPTSPRDYKSERRGRDSPVDFGSTSRPSSGYSRSGVKRPRSKVSPDGHKKAYPSSLSSSSFKHKTSQPPAKAAKTVTKLPVKTVAKPAPIKKKKVPGQGPLYVWRSENLVYLKGIPTDASEQEVTVLAGTYGRINNVILIPCSEEEKEKGLGQKASVCMVTPEEANALASSPNLQIRGQAVTATLPKENGEVSSEVKSSSKPDPASDESEAPKNTGAADGKTPVALCRVLISGLPQGGWSKADITALAQPFAPPFNIIMGLNVGKALVLFSDKLAAEKMVEAHSVVPAKVNDSEVQMSLVKKRVNILTPWALFSLFMSSSELPIYRNRLLVIKNVARTPSAPSDVVNLVRRFGTVIRSLELEQMVICDIATVPMCISVRKRFLMFPCMIENSPLVFARARDGRLDQQKTVPSAAANKKLPGVKSKKTVTAAKKTATRRVIKAEAPLEKKAGDKSEEKTIPDEPTIETKTQEEPEAEKTIQEESTAEKMIQDEPAIETKTLDETKAEKTILEESTAERMIQGEPGVETKTLNEPEAGKVIEDEPVAEKKTPDESVVESEVKDAGVEAVMEEAAAAACPEPKADEKSSTQTNEAAAEETGASAEAGALHVENNPTSELANVQASVPDVKDDPAVMELPKMTQAMVDVLLEEFKARCGHQAANAVAPPSGDQGKKAAGVKGEQAKGSRKEEQEKERERKEREERREKEKKERERRDKERAKREKERVERDRERQEREKERQEREKVRREREKREEAKREEERREWDRRERERRERRRGHHEAPSRTSHRSSSHREERRSAEAEASKEVKGETDDFPLSLSDFVTVDEIGEVGDLLVSPPPDVAAEMWEEGDVPPSAAPQDAAESTSMTAAEMQQPSTQEPKSEAPSIPAVEVSPAAAQIDPVGSQTPAGRAAEAEAAQAQATTPKPDVAAAPGIPPGTDPLCTPTPAPSVNTTSQRLEDEEAERATRPPEEGQMETEEETSHEIQETSSEPENTELMETNTEVEASQKEKGQIRENSSAPANQKETEREEETSQVEETTTDPPKDGPTDKEAVAGGETPAGVSETRIEHPNDQGEESVKPETTGKPLPPYNPNKAVGMEYLVPKTGFFCKVCGRFFSGAKAAEINHCRTLKHYENLQKFLQNPNAPGE